MLRLFVPHRARRHLATIFSCIQTTFALNLSPTNSTNFKIERLQPKPDTGGSKQEFGVVAAQAYPALSRAATALCWSRSDIDDVVQETMLQAFKGYHLFRGESSFVTWAYRILVRTARAANQKRHRHLPATYAQSQPLQLSPADHAVLLDEECRVVIDSIRSLPLRQREVLTLYLLKECSYAEISDALEISVGTVKATIFAAKSALRAALEKKGISKIDP